MKEEILNLLEQNLPLVDFDSEFLYSELDSLGIANILLILSDKYNIELDYSDVTPKNFKNIDNLTQLVRSKLDIES